MRRTPEELRSHRWYGGQELRAVSHRTRARQLGLLAPVSRLG